MHDLLAQVTDFIAAHRDLAGVVVGGLCLIINLALVGIAIPAPPVMITLGGLIGAGMLDMVPVVGGAMLGAAIGYFVSYFLGRWLGPGFVHRWPLKNYRRAVARARLLFRRYAAVAVFFSRFFGPLRVTVPLAAGITGMNQHRFHVANLLSAILWAPALMAPGWVAAQGIEQLEEFVEAQGLAVTLAALAGLVVIVAIGFKLQRDRLLRRRARVEGSRLARP